MPDLLGLARRVLDKAGADEDVEVYVAHGRETSIRVFEGEIEELTAAESAGVGVRVISEGRQGFSYVGALDESAAADALLEARDNAKFATVDEHAGLASPDGVAAPVLDLWREELVSFPTDKKVALAVELERQVRGRRHPHPPSGLVRLCRRPRRDGHRHLTRDRGLEPPDRLLPIRPRRRGGRR